MKKSSVVNIPITLEDVKREQAKRGAAAFMEYDGQGMWQRAAHLELVCSALDDIEAGRLRRLMVFMPPRHGKSEIVSKKWPARFLGRNPDKEIIMASYAADLAYDFSRIARNTLRDHAGLFGVDVSKDSAAVGRWSIEGHRGGLAAAGVGGPITGRGAHVAIIDDPFKNWQEAASKTVRDSVDEWYKSTLRTRLAPGGAIILVMTRWHEDDLAGRLLGREPDLEPWKVISLPAEAGEDDLLGRRPGQWLWPERFPASEYEATRTALGSRLWGALYDQKPRPEEGNILRRDWWRFYKQPPLAFDEIIQSWDCTFKDALTSDFVVGQVWGKAGADKYLLDQVRGRWDLPATIRELRRLSERWPRARAKLIEDKANGPAVISMLRKEIPGLIPIEPVGGKIVRAQAAAPEAEAGNIYLPDPSISTYTDAFIDEATAFPNGANDDSVDCFTQAVAYFGRYTAPTAFQIKM